MARLTITLPDARHRALKQAAAQRAKTIGQLIDESLEFYGVRSGEEALELVRRARRKSGLDDKGAQTLALNEVRAARRGR